MIALTRLIAFGITIAIGAAALVYVVRVEPADLTWLLFTLTAGAWASVVVLGHAAASGPGIGALTERAGVGLTIAALGTVTCLIAVNTDAGRPWFDAETSSLLFRISILSVLAVPCAWLVLWLTGRLGEASTTRIDDLMEAVAENTRLTQDILDDAEATVGTVANTAVKVDDIHNATVDKP